MAGSGAIVAIGLLTEAELRLLGPRFDRGYPLDSHRVLTGLLDAIEQAERDYRRDPSSAAAQR